MRKAIQKAQKADEKASQEATEDTEEATEGTTEGATEEATEEAPKISINDIMSAIMKHIPDATNAQLLAVAEELDPLPRETKELTGEELLQSLGMDAFK